MDFNVKKLLVSAVMTFAVAGHVGVALCQPAALPSGYGNSIKTPDRRFVPHKDAVPISFLHTVILQMETGNRRYDAEGDLITSRRGARGEMQVMPRTIANPGYGVAPAANNSPDEYARVGRDYFSALVKRYKGDLRKAFAAYNAGPVKVNKAVVKAREECKPGQWLAYLPRETKKYVGKSLKRVERGAKGNNRVQVAFAK
jgi:soluble lytic murein transglycosylase